MKQRFPAWKLALGAIAAGGVLVAWWRYPVENHFSILRCTISFLGSPDPDRNPGGWRFYQVGMTAFNILLCQLVAVRHRRLRPQLGRVSHFTTGAIFVALGLMLVVTWVPDTRQMGWLGFRITDWHTHLAVLAIPFLLGGITVEGFAVARAGGGWRRLWPYWLYALLAGVGTYELHTWELMCRRNPTLPHWPGNGLHSTPLWEWVSFLYLVAFLFWTARGPSAAAVNSQS